MNKIRNKFYQKGSNAIRGIIVIALIILAIYGGISLFKNYLNNNSENPTVNVKTNSKIDATTVKVAKFYDGQDGYSLSISSGNRSTCIWTWVDGNASIPDSTTTYANTATEKHTLHISDTASDWKASCMDDFGNQYIGIFPSD